MGGWVGGWVGGGRPGRGGGRQGSTCVRSGGIDGLKSESVGDVEWERGTGRVELVGWEDCTRDLDIWARNFKITAEIF